MTNLRTLNTRFNMAGVSKRWQKKQNEIVASSTVAVTNALDDIKQPNQLC
jgi:hypothetical protein